MNSQMQSRRGEFTTPKAISSKIDDSGNNAHNNTVEIPSTSQRSPLANEYFPNASFVSPDRFTSPNNASVIEHVYLNDGGAKVKSPPKKANS